MLLTDAGSLALTRMSRRLAVRRKAMMGRFLNTFLQCSEERSKLKLNCIILFLLGSSGRAGSYVKTKGTRLHLLLLIDGRKVVIRGISTARLICLRIKSRNKCNRVPFVSL